MTAAFYLPLGLEEGLETAVQRFGPAHDSLELHLPVVGPDDLLRWIQVLRDAREQNLARRPIAGIIRSLDRVSRREDLKRLGERMRVRLDRLLSL